MWAGMWQVPTIENGRALSLLQLRNRLTIQVSDIEPCGSFMHQTSHRAIRFYIYRAQSRQRQGMWLKLESTELARLPLSAAQRRVLAMIQSRAR